MGEQGMSWVCQGDLGEGNEGWKAEGTRLGEWGEQVVSEAR